MPPLLRLSTLRSLQPLSSAPAWLALLGFSACARGGTEPVPITMQLFDGASLSGWHVDIPAADNDPTQGPAFIVRDGNLVSLGVPEGHLITNDSFANYRLAVEYRWPGKTGNCGVLVHASTPRRLYDQFPQSIEVQMNAGHAGDFWCIGEDITVDNMVEHRGEERARWGVEEPDLRRITNLTDDSENEPGEWNVMIIECRGDRVQVWVNGDMVNHGRDCTASGGQIAIQAERAEAEFRRIDLTPL